MRSPHSFLALFTALLVFGGGLSGCAARHAEAIAKLPVADSICLRTNGVKDPEQGLVARKVALFLKQRGFQSREQDCDLVVSYAALDAGQWEVMTSSFLGLRSRSSYKVEGILTVSKAGKVIAEDQPVNLRDYSSKSDVLEALAWEIVDYVTDNYRPAATPSH